MPVVDLRSDTLTIPTEAMRDATCAHAAMWHLAGINPAAGTAGREAL